MNSQCRVARRSERRVSTNCTTWSYAIEYQSGDPCGNRTRLSGLRGRRPEPIDERADSELLTVRRAGVEPAMPEGGWVTATWARQCPADANNQMAQAGIEPAESRRFELRRFAELRTAPVDVNKTTASPMGFEPTISCVTGRRALRAAPRGQMKVGSRNDEVSIGLAEFHICVPISDF